MTQQEFDTYQFTIKTAVMHKGEMLKIIEIDFEKRRVRLENGWRLNHDEIEVIGEKLL